MGMVLAAVAAIAVLMNFSRRDPAYTLVLLWALAGIAVKHAGVAAVVITTWFTFAIVALTLPVAFIMCRPKKGRSLEA